MTVLIALLLCQRARRAAEHRAAQAERLQGLTSVVALLAIGKLTDSQIRELREELGTHPGAVV